MPEPARHLHTVDEHGEVVDGGCPECEGNAVLVEELQRKIKGLGFEVRMLKADAEKEAKGHRLWPLAVKLFEVWKRECRHPNSTWGWERFEQCRPHLERNGWDKCVRAIYGAAFDPFTTSRKNGTAKRHDGWHLIFGKPEQFEDFCNRAPRETLFDPEPETS